jgi:hypothetical protein
MAPAVNAAPLPADVVAQPTAPLPAQSNGSNAPLLAGLAAVLGLAAIALFAITRRRGTRVDDELIEYETFYEPEAEPVPTTPTRSAALVTPAFTPPQVWNEPRTPRTQPAEDRAAASLNRQALIERMVAAEPDANNPFTSPGARRRRARLMLQSMESDRWDDAELAPGFDWREMAQAAAEREDAKV